MAAHGAPAEALLSGQLASALEELKTKSEGEISSTDIEAIKAHAGNALGHVGVAVVGVPWWRFRSQKL